MNLLLLIIALLGLWAGTELAVRKALRLAAALGLSPMFVGLTILALVVGNSIGSGLANIGFAFGVTGLFGYVTLGKRQSWNTGVMFLGSIALFFLVGVDGELTRIDGGVLITVYLIYFATTVRRERIGKSSRESKATVGWIGIGALCLVGFLIIAAASHLAITSAVALAKEWGIEQTFIGIVLIGIGTSLPELAVSLNAVFKKQGALSVGNIVGSNIFNMLIVPGTAAVIAGLDIDSPSMFTIDLSALAVISFLALYFFRPRKGLQKREALTLVIVYMTYIALRMLFLGA